MFYLKVGARPDMPKTALVTTPLKNFVSIETRCNYSRSSIIVCFRTKHWVAGQSELLRMKESTSFRKAEQWFLFCENILAMSYDPFKFKILNKWHQCENFCFINLSIALAVYLRHVHGCGYRCDIFNLKYKFSKNGLIQIYWIIESRYKKSVYVRFFDFKKREQFMCYGCDQRKTSYFVGFLWK